MSVLSDVDGTEVLGAGPVPIIFCPVCASNEDAPAWGLIEMECGNCDTRFAVYLVPSIVATYSMY